MTTRKEIERALRTALPEELQDKALYLSVLLSSVIDHSLTPEEFKEELLAEPAANKAYNKLSGKHITLDKAVISFGQGNQAGDITVRDVAGNNINRIHININVHHNNNQVTPTRLFTENQGEHFNKTTSNVNRASVSERKNTLSDFIHDHQLDLLPGVIWYFAKMSVFPVFGLMCGWFIGYNVITLEGNYNNLDINILLPIVLALVGSFIGFLFSLELHSEKKRTTGVNWWGHFIGMCVIGAFASSSSDNLFPGAFWIMGVFGWGAIWFFLLEGYKELK
jgi:hypothetical protein